MDARSISSALSIIVTASGTIVTTLYTFVGSYRDVDRNVKDLHGEAGSFSIVAEAMQDAWKSNMSVAITCCSRNDSTLWSSVWTALNDCVEMLEILSNKISAIERSSSLARRMSFARRSMQDVQLNLSKEDINRFRKQVQSYCLAMQIALSSFNVILQFEKNKTDQEINKTLKELNRFLEKMQTKATREGIFNPTNRPEASNAGRNLQKLAGAATSFWSNASTAIEGDRTMLWEESVTGEPIGEEKRAEIQNWNLKTEYNDGNGLSKRGGIPLHPSATADVQLKPASTPQRPRASQYRERVAVGVVNRHLQTAVTSIKAGEYDVAEASFKEMLDYHNRNDQLLIRDQSVVRIMFAYVCAVQEKWERVDDILVPGQDAETDDEILEVDLLALLHRHKRDFEKASTYCYKSLDVKTALFGEGSLPVHHSLSLMANLCLAENKHVESKEWISVIQDDGIEEDEASELYEDILSTSLDHVISLLERLSRAQGGPTTMASTGYHTPKPSNKNTIHSPPVSSVPGAANERFASASVRNSSQLSVAIPSPGVRNLVGGDMVSMQRDSNWGNANRVDSARASTPSVYSPRHDETRDVVSPSFPIRSPPLSPPKLTSAMTSKAPVTLAGHERWVFCVAFSPDGKIIASASENSDSQGVIVLWDVETKAVLRTLEGHSKAVWSVAFSPNGKLLVSGSEDSSIRIWDIARGITQRVVYGHDDTVWAVTFSPDGELVASKSKDGSVGIWNAANGTKRHLLSGHPSGESNVVFSPDGKLVATPAKDSSIKLWKVASGEKYGKLRGHKEVLSVAFSPDGRLIASGAKFGTVKVWNIRATQAQCTFNTQGGFVRCLAFSPNSAVVASASEMGTVQLWNSTDGTEINTLKGHRAFVRSVTFSPDGNLLASGSGDNTIKLWGVGGLQRL